MKTTELTGVMLDYWVARAEGLECGVGPASNAPDRVCAVKLSTGWFFPWSPSTDWAIGGPIIEREAISLVKFSDNGSPGYKDTAWEACAGETKGYVDESQGDLPWNGPTALIAAMRAYVCSKFGDHVPDDAGQDGGAG